MIMATPADSEALKWLSEGKKTHMKFQRYRVRFRRRVKAEPSSCKDQNKLEIKESSALEVDLKDDHDTAFMDVDVMGGGKTTILEGGEDTEHENVGGGASDMCTVATLKARPTRISSS